MNSKISFFWFRRDLRIEDNAALFHALKNNAPLQALFIFDTTILNQLESGEDARVTFIYQNLEKLHYQLKNHGSSLLILQGNPLSIWKELVSNHSIEAVYANRDYEPYARTRDKEVYYLLKEAGIPFITKKDHVIFEKNEIVKKDGSPYVVYTPYSKVWKAKLNDFYTKPYASETINHWHPSDYSFPSIESIGFKKSTIIIPPHQIPTSIIKNYHATRDIPSKAGTSRLGIHLRFGTISCRSLVQIAQSFNEKYLNELIWRDFYSAILWHFPHVVKTPFHKKYTLLEWRNNEEEFERWCTGETGYPIVDAGMRELNTTGYMHNRVRMVVASFLTKHLLINWQWGEAYFASKLLDFDLASNNGGWQWAASTGVDAAPYFRIFNPTAQAKKFDPDNEYIQKWIPEIDTPKYPYPLVDHSFARNRALAAYKEALSKTPL